MTDQARTAPKVRLEYPADGVAMLVVDSPPRNAFSTDVSVAFLRGLEEVAANQYLRCLVITGTGRSFTAGADLREQIEVAGQDAEAYHNAPDQMSEVLRRLQALEIPKVAAVNGYALGGGLELALTCDIRVGSESARFVCSGVNVGLILSWHRLPRIVGLGRAMEMLLSGGMYDAKTAYDWGLVSSLVPDEDLLPSVLSLAETIATKPPLSVAATRRHAGAAFDMSSANADGVQAREFVRLMNSEDHHEALTAFLEKRNPIYKGK